MNDSDAAKEIRTAIKSGDVDRVTELIDGDKTRLNAMTPFGTWLHVAAKAGTLDVVKRLIDLGADINAQGGTFGGTAINLACSEGHIDVVRHLLSAGAILDTSEPERNPLFGAIYGGHIEIVRLLLDHGIDPRVKYTGKSMKDMDARAFALERGCKDIAALLADV